jgi:hypothetical protein
LAAEGQTGMVSAYAENCLDPADNNGELRRLPACRGAFCIGSALAQACRLMARLLLGTQPNLDSCPNTAPRLYRPATKLFHSWLIICRFKNSTVPSSQAMSLPLGSVSPLLMRLVASPSIISAVVSQPPGPGPNPPWLVFHLVQGCAVFCGFDAAWDFTDSARS